ncbi:MAG: CADD family putative folate metabolism protein [Fidelibacterota bacterium]
MKPDQVLQRLDRLIESRFILAHPFYQAWNAGELTRDQLATYAAVYYPHVASFPGYLERILSQTTDDSIRDEIEQNLADELSNPKPHPDLWLDFAQGLGLERQEVAGAAPHPVSGKTVKTFENLAESGVAQGLAALYAYESQQPSVSQVKIEGLREFYGVKDPRALAYFEVHSEVDIRHRDGERRAIGRSLEDGASSDDVLGAAEQALNAYWGLLDGIHEEAGLPT